MSSNRIIVHENGPLEFTGELLLQDADAHLIEHAEHLLLCRCGFSANKPWCDGSHQQRGFEASQSFSDERQQEIEDSDTPLVITVKKHAMLSVQGAMTIVSEDGASTTTRQRAALCRCGQSEKKPFCDVSHKKCDFSDEGQLK